MSTVAPQAKKIRTCPICEGRGELYHGAPDALGAESDVCERCAGSGRIITTPPPHPVGSYVWIRTGYGHWMTFQHLAEVVDLRGDKRLVYDHMGLRDADPQAYRLEELEPATQADYDALMRERAIMRREIPREESPVVWTGDEQV